MGRLSLKETMNVLDPIHFMQGFFAKEEITSHDKDKLHEVIKDMATIKIPEDFIE